MPNWVQNFDKSLEEADDDADDVKALKVGQRGVDQGVCLEFEADPVHCF
jgi:hypothetical protein